MTPVGIPPLSMLTSMRRFSLGGGLGPPRLPSFAQFDPEAVLRRVLDLVPAPAPPAPIAIPSVRPQIDISSLVSNLTEAQLAPVRRELELRRSQSLGELRSQLAQAGLAESGVRFGAEQRANEAIDTALLNAATQAAAAAAAQAAPLELRAAELEQQRAIQEAQLQAQLAQLAQQGQLQRVQLAGTIFPALIQAQTSLLDAEMRRQIAQSELAQRAFRDQLQSVVPFLQLQVEAARALPAVVERPQILPGGVLHVPWTQPNPLVMRFLQPLLSLAAPPILGGLRPIA